MIRLSHLNISLGKEYQYLGLYLDYKLLWKRHIEYMKKKCDKGINLLKAPQSVCVLFYSAYLRSILDYGAVFYGSSSKSNLKSIDVIQTQAIKICLGLLRSTPNLISLALVGELPLNYRREILAGRIVLKWRESGETELLSRLSILTEYVLTYSFWRSKQTPPLVEGFTNTATSTGRLKRYKCKPYFSFPYENYQVNDIPIYLPKHSDNY